MPNIYSYKFTVKQPVTYSLVKTSSPSPSSYYITDIIPSIVLDQQKLGSCVANAVYACFYIVSKGQISLSRLQLYMCNRAVDGDSLTVDSGADITNCMKTILSYGISAETLWPYIITNFAKLAPSASFTNTYKIPNFKYTTINQDIETITSYISTNNPVICGILVYTSFDGTIANKYGVIPMPNMQSEQILGGHCILLVGYDTSKKVFKFQNSWGKSWGDNGYGYIPFNYIISNTLTSELTIINF